MVSSNYFYVVIIIIWLHIHKHIVLGDACGVMVIVGGNGHGDTSSNPGRDWLHFT